MRRPGFDPWVGKIPWRRERLLSPYSGLENSTDRIVHGVAKSRTRLRDFHFHEGLPRWLRGKEPACQCKTCKRLQVRSLDQEDALEEGMVTHSSILAWGTPWTEKPGGLQSVVLHRAGHDQAHRGLSTLQFGPDFFCSPCSRLHHLIFFPLRPSTLADLLACSPIGVLSLEVAFYGDFVNPPRLA